MHIIFWYCLLFLCLGNYLLLSVFFFSLLLNLLFIAQSFLSCFLLLLILIPCAFVFSFNPFLTKLLPHAQPILPSCLYSPLLSSSFNSTLYRLHAVCCSVMKSARDFTNYYNQKPRINKNKKDNPTSSNPSSKCFSSPFLRTPPSLQSPQITFPCPNQNQKRKISTQKEFNYFF